MDQVGQQRRYDSKLDEYCLANDEDQTQIHHIEQHDESDHDSDVSRSHDSSMQVDDSRQPDDFDEDVADLDEAGLDNVGKAMDLYTLPVFQSAGISCRPPTNRPFNFHSWHLPDFGGCVDTLDVSLKDNSLGRCPFKPRHVALPLLIENDKRQAIGNTDRRIFQNSVKSNRLLVTKNSHYQDMISIYLANRSTLTLLPQALDEYIPNTEHWESYCPFTIKHKTNYSRTFSQDIIGLSCDTSSNILLANCKHESTAIKLCHAQSTELPFSFAQSNTIDFKCKPSKERYDFKDVYINTYRPGILLYALDGKKIWELREYDLNSRQIQHPLTKHSCGNTTYSSEYIVPSLKSEARSFESRSYRIEGDVERIQSIAGFPNHMQNILYTTNFRLGVFDSRCPDLGTSMMVERSELSTIYPLESFRGSIFSKLDENQFYVLSDSHIRLFDLRYHNTVLNQLSHTLKIKKDITLESMVLNSEICDKKEVVMMNDGVGVSMSVFKKHPIEHNLVNSISCSPPVFVSKPMDSLFKVNRSVLRSIYDKVSNKQITGLQMVKTEKAVSSTSDNITPCFDLLQLIENGSVFYQRFYRFDLDYEAISTDRNSPYIDSKISEANPYPVPEGYIERLTSISTYFCDANPKETTIQSDFDLIDDDCEIIPMDVDSQDILNIKIEPEDNSSSWSPQDDRLVITDENESDIPLAERLTKDEIIDIGREKLKDSTWTLE